MRTKKLKQARLFPYIRVIIENTTLRIYWLGVCNYNFLPIATY